MVSAMNDDRWYFSIEQLENTPSKRFGINADRELSYRQVAANLIQDIGRRLYTSQLCINTAIVYMHRFYMYHPFTVFHRSAMATACIFLAAKNEEQPRKLDYVLKVYIISIDKNIHNINQIDNKSPVYLEQLQELLKNEDTLLKTLGFETAIDHPHTHIVRCCNLVKANKDLAQTAYFMASNTLLLTTMCIQYKPTIVACFCIHLACKWSKWKIKDSKEGKPWFWYVDQSVTIELLEQITTEFLTIFDRCPSRLKQRLLVVANSIDKSGAIANYYAFQQRQSSAPSLSSNCKQQHHSRMINTRPTPSKFPKPVVLQPTTKINSAPVDHKFVVPVTRPISSKKQPTPVPNKLLAPVKPKVEIPTTLNNNIKNKILPQSSKSIPKPPERVIRQKVATKQEMVVKPEPIRNRFSVGRDKHSEYKVIKRGLKEMTKLNDLNILSAIKSRRESPSKVKKPSIFNPVPEDELKYVKPFIIKYEPAENNIVIKSKPMSPEIVEVPKFDSELMLNPFGPTSTMEMDEETCNSNTDKKKRKKHKKEIHEKKKHKSGKHRHHKHKDQHKEP